MIPSANTPPSGYLVPPPEILAVVDAPPQPSLSFSPDRSLMLELHRPPPLPPVAELARDELKLAGLRIDAGITSRSRMGHYTALSVVKLGEGVVVPAAEAKKLGMNSSAVEVEVTGLPEGCGINFVTWATDGKRIAFTVRAVDDGVGGEEDGEKSTSSSSNKKRLERGPLSLWVADVATGQARCVLENLATVLDDYAWCSDTEIVALRIPQSRGEAPKRPPVPLGPRIQDNSHAGKSQGRTFPDLLRDEHDDELFEHYCTSDIVKVDVVSGEVTALTGEGGNEGSSPSSPSPSPLHPSRLYSGISPSPDGRYLAVSWIERPFSRQFPAGRFPRVTQLWKLHTKSSDGKEEPLGAFAAEVAKLPLADDIPIAMDSVRKGPRSLGWRADKDACMYWIEAQDGGDPNVEVRRRKVGSFFVFFRFFLFHFFSFTFFLSFSAHAFPIQFQPLVTQVDPRDIVYSWEADDAAAFAASPEGKGVYPPSSKSSSSPLAPLRIAETKLRCGGFAWGDEDLALLYESRYKDRRSITWAFSPGEAEKEARAGRGSATAAAPATAAKKRIVFDLPDYEDAYANPGSPLLARTPRGTYVLARPDGKRALLLAGSGATPEGLVPFLDVLDLGPADSASDSSSSSSSMTSTRLWRSSPPNFESAGSILSDGACDRGGVQLDGLRLLLSRESADVPPQTFIATFEGVSMDDLPFRAEKNKVVEGEEGESKTETKTDAAVAARMPSKATLLLTPSEKQLTAFPHPHPSLTGAQKRVLRYERSDGVPLTATLHTPPGYDAKRDGPLPIFLWLYPREFKNKEAAGQMRRSPHEFSGVGSSSPLLFLTRGYAVLDGPTFPIVAEENKEKENDGEKEGGGGEKKEKKEAEPNDT